MATSFKSLGLGLLVSLIVGAGLGAYGAIQWKEREVADRVAAAVQEEQERQRELYEERDALREKVERQRLRLELVGIAAEVERQNFGLARARLTTFGDDLESLMAAADASRRDALQAVLTSAREVTADLEALNPEAASKLHRLSGQLQQAVGD